MKLVVLYGRPAVGKLTVARELAALTGGRLFHNHLTVNLALAIHDFGTAGFVALRDTIWRAAFASALAERVPLLIFTFNPENSVPQRFVDDLYRNVASAGGEVVTVELTASESAIEERLGDASRKREGKSLRIEDYRSLRAKGAFDQPVIPPPMLTIQTDMMEPRQAAERIASLLGR